MSDLNGDLSIRVRVDTKAMEFSPSPSGKVERKRLHLVGPVESGQVTSVVRYLPGASFPAHDHPEGEEIFVISGVFSDQTGDAGEGMYLLNPESFRHAPHSDPGCLIFVKLRQYAGPDRPTRRVDTRKMEWRASEFPGVEEKVLFAEPAFPDATRLERWAPGSQATRRFPGGAELFVLEGALQDSEERYDEGTWLRWPAGTDWDARSETGCTLYLKTGALPSLRTS